MKSKPAEKKTLKLKIEDRTDFKLMGISSHENDYRLVWSINNELNMQFTRTGNLVVHHKKLEIDPEFSRYHFHDEDRYVKYILIANHCPDGILFPEIKNFDFLMQITGDFSDSDAEVLSRKLKGISIISAVYMLQPAQIKGIKKVLDD